MIDLTDDQQRTLDVLTEDNGLTLAYVATEINEDESAVEYVLFELAHKGLVKICNTTEPFPGKEATYLRIPKETLKYNYGETPEDVIRERLAEAQAAYSREPNSDVPAWIAYIEPDDLLTVLDALLDSNYVNGVEYNNPAAAQKAINLRISILAALGIDES